MAAAAQSVWAINRVPMHFPPFDDLNIYTGIHLFVRAVHLARKYFQATAKRAFGMGPTVGTNEECVEWTIVEICSIGLLEFCPFHLCHCELTIQCHK